MTMPFVASAYSSMRGVASRPKPMIRGALALGIVFLTIWTYQGGNGPWTTRYGSGIWGLNHDAHAQVLDAALRQVPDKDQNPRDADRVDYLVIDRAMVTDDPYKDLLRRIEESPCYAHVFDQSDVVVLKRLATDCPV